MADFWAKLRIDEPNKCWPWTACKHRTGYGMFGWRGKIEGAHRVAYEQVWGDIPQGMHVLHRCDNPGCVNPNHLWLGTHSENMADMARKGRAPIAGRKISFADAEEIRARARRGETQRMIGEAFGVSHGVVGCIVRGESYLRP